ncbi:Spy/CpxP family protein refolding chaperone [Desulfobacterales bacterium HSG16]|nr:Spy/CpxP family protein refolding chaperone [Desulfobacterales bacterium HSG16]
MKKRTKCITIGVVTIALILGCVAFIYAHNNPGSFCHRQNFKKHIRAKILNHIDEKIMALNLNDTQEEKWETIKGKVTEGFDACTQKRKAFIDTIDAELNNENPDMEKIAGIVKDHVNKIPAVIETHINHVMEFYNVLDADQQQKVIEKMREHIGECGKV